MVTKSSKRRKTIPQLKVVFDTNVLWTGSASDLLKQEVLELVNENSQHADLAISWYLPDIVRHERQYQMLAQSLELLPSLRKLERLLGHNLNITEEIMEQRVNQTVDAQIKKLGINIIPLDTSRVEWSEVVFNAAYRRPPFSAGEKEKGFRDAVLVEDFLQLVGDSPVTPKVCRIALVTGDALLSQTVDERTKSNSNVRILASLEELKSLINTLVAEVSEEFVSKIQAKAQTCFFEVDQKETIYYKENLRKVIGEKFKKRLLEVPQGAQSRENGTWYVSHPRFLRKQGQRVFWASRISIEAKAYKYEVSSQPSASYPTLSPMISPLTAEYPRIGANPFLVGTGLINVNPYEQGLLPSSSAQQPSMPVITREKIFMKAGKSVFEVIWSVTVTATGKLSSPRIESTEFVENMWD